MSRRRPNNKEKIIQAYLQEQQDEKNLQHAMQEAEIALMSTSNRFQYANQTLLWQKHQFRQELQRLSSEYKRLLRSCSLHHQEEGQKFLLQNFPYLVLSRSTLEKVLQRVRTDVEHCVSKESYTTDELNTIWYRTLRQMLGLVPDTVPHPEVINNMIPQ